MPIGFWSSLQPPREEEKGGIPSGQSKRRPAAPALLFVREASSSKIRIPTLPSAVSTFSLGPALQGVNRAVLTFYARDKRVCPLHSDLFLVTILLVEDHRDSRDILSGLLNHCGHEVITAANIEDALRLLGHLRFEALVCDIGLPDGSGLDLVVEAKKRQPWKKTVALTAHEQCEEMELGLRAGFDAYLTKPFDFHQLRSILEEAPRVTTPAS